MNEVVVTPLAPPFDDDVTVFRFAEDDKMLAVSMSDGEKIAALFSGPPDGRHLILERADGDKIKVSAVVS